MADELKENIEQETKPSKKKSKLFWALLASGIGAVIIAVVLLVVFLMPKEEKFDINLCSSGTTSSVVLTGDGSYTKGDSVTIVAQDIEGYRFVNWTYNGNIVSDEREYTFVIGESTQGEYTANYARVYKIKASENQYGTFTINPTSAIAGEEITVEFEIGSEYQDEYTFSDLYYMYNGNTTENIIENNRFIMPEGDVTVYARLDNLYNINLTSNISDSVEVDLTGEGLYAENASATITAPYVEGYRFRSWTLNDQVVSTNQIYTIENINASTSGTYVANYDSPYQITIKSSSGDIVVDAFENDEMTYQTEIEDIIQNTEIILQRLQILADGEEIPYTEENGQYSFIMPASDVVIDVVEDSRLTRITDFMIMGNTIIDYAAGNATEIVVPSSYKLYEQETSNVQVYQSFEEFTNHFGGEGNPIVSQLLAGFYYKTKDSNEFVEATFDEAADFFMRGSGQFWNVANNPNSYPLTIKLKTEYTVTQEIFNSLLDYNDEKLIPFAILGPFMQVMYAPYSSGYLSDMAMSFTYQIGEQEPVDVDVSNISVFIEEITQSMNSGGGVNALLSYIPIKFTNIRYGNCYICEGEGIDITTIEGGFDFNTNITKVTISEGITTLNDELFNGCTSLKEISIPSTLTKVGQYTFNGCNSLLYNKDDNGGLYLGNSNNPYVLLVDIDESQGAVSSFNVNENCKVIGSHAFADCSSLSSVNIPSGVILIGSYAFSNCNSLNNVYYNGTLEQWANITFDGSWIPNLAINLYMNNQLVEEITLDKNVKNYAFEGIQSLKKVTLKEGVTSIGHSAFSDCINLAEINLPSSLETIGEFAFSDCRSLISVDIPAKITAISNYTFYNCRNLQTVVFADNSKLERIGVYAFASCTSLIDLKIPDCIVYVASLAFDGCDQLLYQYNNGGYFGNDENKFLLFNGILMDSRPDIPLFSVQEGCKIIGPNSFSHCNNLSQILFPSSVMYIEETPFTYCDNLQVIQFLSNSRLETVEYDRFNNITSLQTISFGDNSSLREIKDRAFEGCTNLQSIDFGENSQLQIIGEYAISGSLTSITIPASVTNIGYGAFSTCHKLTDIYYQGTLEQWLSINFADSWSPHNSSVNLHIDNQLITEITISNDLQFRAFKGVSLEKVTILEGVTAIDSNSFRNCSNLTEITIPASVTSIGEYAFSDCSNLQKITFAEGSQLQSIGNSAFQNCTSLSSITIPAGVTTIDYYAFQGCNSLATVDFGTNSQLQSIGDFAFGNCTNLTTVNFGTNSQLQSIGFQAFYNCRNLHSITIPAGVTTIGDNAFSSCFSLALVINNSSNITITKGSSGNGEIGYYAYKVVNSDETDQGKIEEINNVYYYTNSTTGEFVALGSAIKIDEVTSITLDSRTTIINQYAFYGCSSLSSITIPAGVTSIGSSAFSDCTNLTTVDFGDNSQLQSIGSSAFYGCSSLTTIDFGDNSQLQSINSSAFQNCTSLSSITIPAGVTTIDYYAFDGCNNLTSVTIESDDIYNAAVGTDGWSHVGGLLANATTVKVQKTIVDGEGNVNNYLNSSTFTKTVSEDGFYYIYELKNQSNL